jgi:hypothetical protein
MSIQNARNIPAALTIVLFVVAGTAHARFIRQTDGPSGTVGVQLLDLAPDTIGLRYRLRVDECADNVSKKMVFVGVRTATPGAPAGSGRGTIQMDVMSHWVGYEDDLGHAGWPEQGTPHRGQPSLWLRNVDYGGVGRVGIRPMSVEARRRFPRQCAGIDRVNGHRSNLTSIAAIHQGSILKRDVWITLVRQPLVQLPPSLDWGHRFTPSGQVTASLPGGWYWPWQATIEVDGEPPVQLVFLVDEARGQYVAPDGGVSIRTEFFLRPDVPTNQLGNLQMYVSDVETLSETNGRWVASPRWEYGEDLAPYEPAVGYGFRATTFDGRPALEVSYFSLAHFTFRYPGYYAQVGDVLDLGTR